MRKAEDVGMSTERLKRITSWLEAQVSSNRLAGCSALVARHGEIVYQQSTGSPTSKQARHLPTTQLSAPFP